MPITQTKIKSGSLTFTVDGTDYEFSCQHNNVKITPAHNTDGDPLEVLCGDVLPADTTRTDTLAITSIQDFDDPDGFQAFTWANDMAEAAVVWKPQGDTGMSYAGTVTVYATEVGGDVNKRLSVDCEFPSTGAFVPTYP